MIGFFNTLVQNLADRWLATLTLPGVVFLAGASTARELGHANALDFTVLAEAIEQTVNDFSAWSVVGQALGLIAVAALGTGLGLMAQGLSGLTRWFWLDEGASSPRLSWLTTWRANRLQKRWAELIASRQPTKDREAAEAAHRAALRISMATPGRATWMGNRIHALHHSIQDIYGLDLYWVWPPLWTVLPAGVREDLTTAHTTLHSAAVRATWAFPWFVLAFWWWPALSVSVALAVSGWHAGRNAIDTLAQLIEAAVDTHGPTLAVHLGLTAQSEALTREIGSKITNIARKNR